MRALACVYLKLGPSEAGALNKRGRGAQPPENFAIWSRTSSKSALLNRFHCVPWQHHSMKIATFTHAKYKTTSKKKNVEINFWTIHPFLELGVKNLTAISPRNFRTRPWYINLRVLKTGSWVYYIFFPTITAPSLHHHCTITATEQLEASKAREEAATAQVGIMQWSILTNHD